MKFISTRDPSGKLHSFTSVVLSGLADDGGLFVPINIPKINFSDFKERRGDFKQVCFDICRLFIDDIDDVDLHNIINKSYLYPEKWNCQNIVKLSQMSSISNVKILELFHGPSAAFKDVALQFLGNLFEHILTKSNSHLNILGATSGDTGSAAIYGLSGKKNITVSILFPDGKTSAIQEAQMTSVLNNNVYPIGMSSPVDNFDKCQTIVKNIFSNLELKKDLKLGAINSINFARILAQIVYYAYICIHENEPNFIVPTGNFGNILAGFYAREMGFPINRLIIASNSNDVLPEFFESGTYSPRPKVIPTMSPSMDICLSSNFERFIHYICGTEECIRLFSDLKNHGKFTVSSDTLKTCQSYFEWFSINEDETINTIKYFIDNYKLNTYIPCPHSAVGIGGVLLDKIKRDEKEDFICLATAHYGKFPLPMEGVCDLTDLPDSLMIPEGERRKFNLTCEEEVVEFLKKNLKE